MPPESAAADEGRLASTALNRAAGRALRVARQSMTPPDDQSARRTGQAVFAERLSELLGVTLTATAISNWENGRRSVPSAVLLAAAMAAGQSIDALLGEAGEPVVLEWVTKLGLPARIDQLEAELHRARSELQGQIEELRREVAQYHVELMDLSSSRPIVEPQRSDAPSSRNPAHG